MSWTRAELKEKGKKAFLKNYWWCVLTTFLLSLFAGGGSGIKIDKEDIESIRNLAVGSYTKEKLVQGLSQSEEWKQLLNILPQYWGTLLIIGGVIALIVLLFVLLLTIFLVYPIQIGGCKFFLENREGKPTSEYLLYTFQSGNYLNSVFTMFKKDAFIFLWSLLLIIPGIIKAYEYRLVPYLLAINPGMDSSEALAKSRELMDGQKMEAFVLDLSFIGWALLSVFTLGLLDVFFVSPYRYATNAELFATLNGRGTSSYYGEDDWRYTNF